MKTTALSKRRMKLLPEDVTSCKPPGGSGVPPTCPFCHKPLDSHGCCKRCDMAYRSDDTRAAKPLETEARTPPPHDAGPPEGPTRRWWDQDTDGCALLWLYCAALGLWIRIACFIPYPHPVRRGHSYPWWPRPFILPGVVIQLLLGMNEKQFDAVAAHLQGRLNRHGRWYDTWTFMEAYWEWLRRPGKRMWKTRAEQKSRSKERHRRAHCVVKGCRKAHRQE
jgi:hypothetical protein